MASKSHKNILLLNGPNLNLLGTREPGIYGSDNLPAIEQRLIQQAKAGGATLEAFQSNSEADLVNRIQQAARDGVDFIIINPAAYTHTSVAMRDALDRKSTRLNSSHSQQSRMPSSA